MSTPVLFDTDMGVDDAVGLALALSAPQLDVVGVTSVGGNVPIEQATLNVGRVLDAIRPPVWPKVARGLDQAGPNLPDATHVHGADGLGEVDLPVPATFSPGDYLSLYEELIGRHGDALAIVAVGPLTNLAAVLRQRPGLLQQVGRIVVMGGAVWCKGNVTPHAEFNFYRDPAAAMAVLDAGLPVTVVSLDVTTQVAMDESHVANLSRSASRAGQVLARMIRFPLRRPQEGEVGRFLVHDALAVGTLLWPELFLRSKMGMEIVISGPQVGRSKPKIAKDKSKQIAVVVSVNVLDFLENLLETLCQEKFVV